MRSLLFLLVFSGILSAAPVPPEIPPDPTEKAQISFLFELVVEMDGDTLTTRDLIVRDARAPVIDGDRVVRIGDTPVSTQDEFYRELDFYRPGAVVKLEVVRGDKTETLRLPLK